MKDVGELQEAWFKGSQETVCREKRHRNKQNSAYYSNGYTNLTAHGLLLRLLHMSSVSNFSYSQVVAALIADIFDGPNHVKLALVHVIKFAVQDRFGAG